MSDNLADDRRRAPRAPIELKVEYKRTNAFLAEYTRNISRGGTFIRTDKPLEIGTKFQFDMSIPSLGEPLQLRGVVRWVVQPDQADESQPAGMGIEFVYSSTEEQQRITKAVEALMIEQLGEELYRKMLAEQTL